ncbi:MAG: purine-nucleoside phosphorylase [Bacillota bacterium]|nr:purine-nucleoside phosphorylase [Bacillota bacterium]
MSTHILAASKGEVAETVLLPGDPLRAKYIAENYLNNARCYSKVRNMLGFTGTYKGVPVSVQGTGMGMPSMGIYSYELIHEFDCRRLIRVGTAGAFLDTLRLGDVLVAVAASTDSNFVHTYKLPGNYAPSASYRLLSDVRDAGKSTGIGFTAGNIVSCDVFYEHDPAWWKSWADMGIMGVEMEAAALYMNAAAAGVDALAVMTVSDHFVTNEKADVDERERGFTDMMKLSLETAIR